MPENAPSAVSAATAAALNPTPPAAQPAPPPQAPPPPAGPQPVSAYGHQQPHFQTPFQPNPIPTGEKAGDVLGDDQLRMLSRILPPEQFQSVAQQVGAVLGAENAGYGLDKIQAASFFAGQAIDRVEGIVAGTMAGQAQLAVYQANHQTQLVEGIKQYGAELFNAHQRSQRFQWNRDVLKPAMTVAAVVGTAGALLGASYGVKALFE